MRTLKLKQLKGWVFVSDNGDIIKSSSGRIIFGKTRSEILKEYPWWKFRAREVVIKGASPCP